MTTDSNGIKVNDNADNVGVGGSSDSSDKLYVYGDGAFEGTCENRNTFIRGITSGGSYGVGTKMICDNTTGGNNVSLKLKLTTEGLISTKFG